MTSNAVYVVARGISGRPMVMHRLVAGSTIQCVCGRELSAVSRSYSPTPLDAIMCKRCTKA